MFMQEELFEKKENSLFDIKNDALYGEVIIPLALPQNYTWRIPEHLQSSVQCGSRVEVQLRNKKYAGIIKTLHHNKPEAFEPKEILNVLDAEPVVYSNQLQLWQWIADYYMCSEGEVMNAAVPTNLKLSSESILWWNEEHGNDFSDLNDEEYIVAEALEVKKELRLSEVQQLLLGRFRSPSLALGEGLRAGGWLRGLYASVAENVGWRVCVGRRSRLH